MKKLLLIFIAISSHAFSMQEMCMIYNKAMVKSSHSKKILWCCPEGFRGYGDGANTGIKQKNSQQEDLHMSLPKLRVFKHDVYSYSNDKKSRDNKLKKKLSEVFKNIKGKKFHVTGLDPNFGSWVVAEVVPISPLPEGVLEENPHISLFRAGNAGVREKFVKYVDLQKLKTQPIIFDVITLEEEIVQEYKDHSTGKRINKKEKLEITVDENTLKELLL